MGSPPHSDGRIGCLGLTEQMHGTQVFNRMPLSRLPLRPHQVELGQAGWMYQHTKSLLTGPP